ncbi:putative rheb small monomeric gtpase protein [Golovinomyces cichoracearum]|uniref:Putative rheb small monomeric gtpase protein n=1 Tax=Golovinomyces cichoracearum TaxID=62708 RepID=A0A420INP7_9PEZI|nr:putative rheb small monomeric gtpase protein [Golovinomyces cichoracearum]
MANNGRELHSRKRTTTYGKAKLRKNHDHLFMSVTKETDTRQMRQTEISVEEQAVERTISVSSFEDNSKKKILSSIPLETDHAVHRDRDIRRSKVFSCPESQIPRQHNSFVLHEEIKTNDTSHVSPVDKQATITRRMVSESELSAISQISVGQSEKSISGEGMGDEGAKVPINHNNYTVKNNKARLKLLQDSTDAPKSAKEHLRLKRKLPEVSLKAPMYKMNSRAVSNSKIPKQDEISIFDVPLSDDETVPYKPSPTRSNKKADLIKKKAGSLAVTTNKDGKNKQKPLQNRSKTFSLSKRLVSTRHATTKAEEISTPKIKSCGNSNDPSSLERVKPQHSTLKASPKSLSEKTESIPSSPTLTHEDMRSRRKPRISHESYGAWQEFLGSMDDTEKETLNQTSSADVNTAAASLTRVDIDLSQSTLNIKELNQSSTTSTRIRMIDSLRRSPSQSSSNEDSIEGSESDCESFPSMGANLVPVFEQSCRGVEPEIANPQPTVSSNQISNPLQCLGPRFTYSRQRSMLAEEDLMKEFDFELPTSNRTSGNRRNRRGSVPELQPLSNFHEEEDDDKVLIKSVHELRKSGAMKRFVDECTDLFDRIGSSEIKSPLRRSGLVELAGKMMDMSFVQNFLANSMEQQLFIDLDKETDILSGFLIISILISVLMRGPLAHIIPLLCRHGITKLIIDLLGHEIGIAAVCKDRKTNMSKMAQSLVIEHHNSLLKLPLWNDLELEILSPRTIALGCLKIISQQSPNAEVSYDVFSDELSSNLFSIMKSISCEESFKNKRSVDFFLTVVCLQTHYTTACSLLDESKWIKSYLPLLADVLETDLTYSCGLSNDAHLVILKMTLQVTNNNQLATEVFARPSLLLVLSKTLVSQFHVINSPLAKDGFLRILDHISLLLGVLMNFSEWSQYVRECMQNFESQDDVDPLREMIYIFQERSEKISQAESEQETLQNVVLGYLSVTLGFLSLHPPIGERLRKQKHKLLACIEEFILIHKLADKSLLNQEEIIANDDDNDTQMTNGTDRYEVQIDQAQMELTGRLERLVDQLKSQIH